MLDQEKISQRHLIAVATDESEKPMLSSVSVRINVIDENDNAPLFRHNNEETMFVVVKSEDVKSGTMRKWC